MIRDIAWQNGDFVVGTSGDVALAANLAVVKQDLLARLTSPRGSHWAHPAEGVDLQKFINAGADELTRLELRQDVELEAGRDARVRRAAARVSTPDLRSGHIAVTAQLRRETIELIVPLSLGRP